MNKLCALAASLALALFTAASPAWASGSGTITFDVAVQGAEGGKPVRLWMPYPLSDGYQDISQVSVSGTYDASAVYRDAKSGAVYLFAEWKNPQQTPSLRFAFHVDSRFVKGPQLKDGGNALPKGVGDGLPKGAGDVLPMDATDVLPMDVKDVLPMDVKDVLPVDVQPYLASSPYIPSADPRIKALALEATQGKDTLPDKARAVYDWTIAHTYRDPDVKGCGLGKPLVTLTEARGGGKCADISSVFVAVARAAGIPAREVFGLRGSGKSGDMTGDFHCWAEFYLPGTGWVMADPADVRKAMLVEKIAEDSPQAREKAEFFWNGDPLFRIALSRSAKGVTFTPAQASGPLEYFMYPYAEVDGKAPDYKDPKAFSYSVTFVAD